MAEIYLCTEVLQDDGKTYSKTHFHVVSLANYVALQEQPAALLNNLEAADKAVARNLVLESRLAKAVAALHRIAHADTEASALRLRFMAAAALIAHNTASSAEPRESP